MSKKDPSSYEMPDFVKKNLHTQDHPDTSDDENATPSLKHLSYEEVEDMLNDTTANLEDQKSQVMRLHAEMDNMRKRAESDIAKAHKYGLDRFVNELLPVLDSLDRGLAIDVHDNEYAKRIYEGLEMTRNLFLNTLEKFAVKAVDPMDQPFNPDLHQAISMEENNAVPANTVLKVLQKGYTLNDRLIRPALVIVSKA